MSALVYANPFHRPAGALDLNPLIRGIVIVAGTVMTALCLFAVARAVLGLTPELPHLRNLAIAFHVSTVVPCVPLGLYLLLAPRARPCTSNWASCGSR